MNRTIHTTAGSRRAIVALDAQTGEVGLHAAPAVADGVVVIGSATGYDGVWAQMTIDPALNTVYLPTDTQQAWSLSSKNSQQQ